MNIRQVLTSLFLIAAAFSWAPIVAVKPVDRIAFPEDEYIGLASTGTAIVKAQAFLKTRGATLNSGWQ